MTTKTITITTVEIDRLTIHPVAAKIYQQHCIKALQQSIASDDLLEPLLIDRDFHVLAGNRRLSACKALGWTHVPARIVDYLDERAVSQLIIGSNQQRRKTTLEIMNEAEEILGLLGKNQGQRRDLLGPDNDPESWGKIGKDRFEIAAAIIGNGMSATTLRRLMYVKDFEEKHPEAKDKLNLTTKVATGELSVSKAQKLAKTFEGATEAGKEIKGTKKPLQKNATVKKAVVKEKKIKLAATCYHYYRNFLKDFLRPVVPSSRFQKSPDSYDGHITVSESERAKALKALEKWNKENPDVKELFWDIKK